MDPWENSNYVFGIRNPYPSVDPFLLHPVSFFYQPAQSRWRLHHANTHSLSLLALHNIVTLITSYNSKLEQLLINCKGIFKARKWPPLSTLTPTATELFDPQCAPCIHVMYPYQICQTSLLSLNKLIFRNLRPRYDICYLAEKNSFYLHNVSFILVGMTSPISNLQCVC